MGGEAVCEEGLAHIQLAASVARLQLSVLRTRCRVAAARFGGGTVVVDSSRAGGSFLSLPKRDPAAGVSRVGELRAVIRGERRRVLCRRTVSDPSVDCPIGDCGRDAGPHYF